MVSYRCNLSIKRWEFMHRNTFMHIPAIMYQHSLKKSHLTGAGLFNSLCHWEKKSGTHTSKNHKQNKFTNIGYEQAKNHEKVFILFRIYKTFPNKLSSFILNVMTPEGGNS